MAELPSGTVTFLFTDVEGSTRLLKQLRERYGQVLAEHRRILRAAFAEYGGREIDTQGDAFFVAFARARDAVGATVVAQRALAAHTWPEDAVCRVRMGLHTGEPVVGEEGYHGMGVHRGARICAAAHGGQILLSNTTRELAEDELPPGVGLRDLGEQWLKDIDRPERIYQLVVDGLPSEFSPLRTARPASAVTAARRRPPAVLLVGALAAVAAVTATIVLVTGGGSKPVAAAGEVSADSVGIFRPDSGRFAGEIPVGASPGGVAAGFDSVWVSNVDAHSVSRVDPVKGVTIQTIPVGNGPAGIAVGGRFVWVANGQDGTVSQIDPQTDTEVQKIGVGNGPSGVAADAHGVWVANAHDGSLTQIDPRTGTVVRRRIPVGQSADGIALGFDSVWVTSESTGSVTRIDARSRRVVTTVATGSGAGAVAIDFGRRAVWVANSLGGTVTRIDPVTNAVRATIAVGDGPNGIAVTPGAVWVSNELAGTLSKIDPVRNVVIQTQKTGNRPEGIVLDSGALYVAVRASGAGHHGGTLTVLTTAPYFANVDPALAYLSREEQMVLLTNDGLTGLRRTGGSAGLRLVPDLAVSLPAATDGGRSYTFQLRPGIRYSSGALVRPQDFRRAIERSLVLAGGFETYYAGIMGARRCLAAPKEPCDLSKGIVTDPASNTVTFHLTSPDPDLFYELALPAAYAVPAGTPLHAHVPLPATGPYEIASFKPKRAIRLVRNPKFREWSPAAQPSGFPDVIVEHFKGSPDAHVSAVVHGSADLASNLDALSPALLASLRTQRARQLEVNPSVGTYFLVLNTRVAPFDDVRVRQALNFAIDRARLRDLTIGQGLGQLTCQVLPPDFQGYRRYCPYTAKQSSSGIWTAPNLARARQLVRSAGTAGQAVTVWMPDWIQFGPDAGRYVVSVLDNLGYKARFRSHFRIRVGSRFRSLTDPYPVEDKLRLQVGFAAWGEDFTAPSGFFVATLTCGSYNPVNSENSNFAEFCDHAIDREITHAESLQTSDPEAASRLWAKIDRDVVHQAPWVPFANGVTLEVTSTRVHNYQYNPQLGTLLDQLWVR
ncbi:MAG: ABC transporter substrate-binding protein [Actinomycetota bacterium]|nr:ABC transporter substrate-binding protein [Actinomycetota bacterium]